MRITIVGCGAMGSIYAGLLASAGHDVTGIDTNSAHVDAIKRNGLRVSGASGDIAIEAQLVTAEAAMANSLASIVRGLISLQVFNEDLDPEILGFLQNTAVSVEGTTLSIKTALDPKLVVDSL